MSPSFKPWPPKKFDCRYGVPVLCESEPATMPVLYGLNPRACCIARPSFSPCRT